MPLLLATPSFPQQTPSPLAWMSLLRSTQTLSLSSLTSESMSGLVSMPDEVLTIVMQHVPLKDRLTSCCLVNKRLHAASVAATQEIVVGGYWDTSTADKVIVSGIPSAHSFQQWLHHYGQQLTNLELLHFCQPLQQLPCPNLLELTLKSCSVQLGPSAAGFPGVIQSCTKLTEVVMQCDIIDAPMGAAVDIFSTLVHLEGLHINLTDPNGFGLSCSSLPLLTRLTSLTAHNLAAENLAQLGFLTNLLDLGLLGYSISGIGPSSVPGLVLPASITSLDLRITMQPAILSLVPTGLRSLWIECAVHGPAEGPDSFLSGMARLQQLTQLYLETRGSRNWPPPGPAYSALTASSNLACLVLKFSDPPGRVWSLMFPAAHKLPHLKYLYVNIESDFGGSGSPSEWVSGHVSSLVSCCPNLCLIDELDMQLGPHVSELHKLTALTKLRAMYGSGDLPACQQSLRGLAALTQLRELSFEFSAEVTVASLLPLTSLTALTEFECHWQPGLDIGEDDADFSFKQETRWDTPVWLQMLRRCLESNCEPAALHSLAQQLAGPEAAAVHRAVIIDQQQQLLMHQRQIDRQRERIDEQEQQLANQRDLAARQAVQIADLQSQLSAQQHVAAQQGAQNNYLHGQLSAQQQATAQHDAHVAYLQGQLSTHQGVLAQQAA